MQYNQFLGVELKQPATAYVPEALTVDWYIENITEYGKALFNTERRRNPDITLMDFIEEHKLNDQVFKSTQVDEYNYVSPLVVYGEYYHRTGIELNFNEVVYNTRPIGPIDLPKDPKNYSVMLNSQRADAIGQLEYITPKNHVELSELKPWAATVLTNVQPIYEYNKPDKSRGNVHVRLHYKEPQYLDTRMYFTNFDSVTDPVEYLGLLMAWPVFGLSFDEKVTFTPKVAISKVPEEINGNETGRDVIFSNLSTPSGQPSRTYYYQGYSEASITAYKFAVLKFAETYITEFLMKSQQYGLITAFINDEDALKAALSSFLNRWQPLMSRMLNGGAIVMVDGKETIFNLPKINIRWDDNGTIRNTPIKDFIQLHIDYVGKFLQNAIDLLGIKYISVTTPGAPDPFIPPEVALNPYITPDLAATAKTGVLVMKDTSKVSNVALQERLKDPIVLETIPKSTLDKLPEIKARLTRKYVLDETGGLVSFDDLKRAGALPDEDDQGLKALLPWLVLGIGGAYLYYQGM